MSEQYAPTSGWQRPESWNPRPAQGDRSSLVVSTPYIVCVFHSDSHGRRDELAQALEAELRDVGLHRTLGIVVQEGGFPSTEVPVVGVYLGSDAAASDPAV